MFIFTVVQNGYSSSTTRKILDLDLNTIPKEDFNGPGLIHILISQIPGPFQCQIQAPFQVTHKVLMHKDTLVFQKCND